MWTSAIQYMPLCSVTHRNIVAVIQKTKPPTSMTVWREIVYSCQLFFHLPCEMTLLDVFQSGWHIVNVVYPPFLCITHMPLNLKWNTQNYLKGKWWLLVAENLQMTVSFYLCTLFQGKTEGVRDLKSDTSAYLLERVFLLSKGLRAECFFLSLFFFFSYSSPLRSTLLIKDHAYSPRRVLQHYNSSPQVQLSGVPHFFSSLSLYSPFLASALPPSFLLACLPNPSPFFSCTSHSPAP